MYGIIYLLGFLAFVFGFPIYYLVEYTKTKENKKWNIFVILTILVIVGAEIALHIDVHHDSIGGALSYVFMIGITLTIAIALFIAGIVFKISISKKNM